MIAIPKPDILVNVATKLAPIVDKVKLNSPEILLVSGVVCIIGGTVLACKETLKVDDILMENAEKMGMILDAEETIEDEEVYSADDAAKDKVVQRLRTTGKLIRNYIPAGIAMGAGLTCIIASHNIQQSRIAGLCVAYETLNEGYRRYRDRVIDELGEEKDRDFRLGIKAEEVTEQKTLKNGKTKDIVKTHYTIGENGMSEYAICFDESCSGFTKSPGYNKHFVLTQQQIANDMLQARGKLFLRDVYSMLGAPRELCDSWVARNVGWVLGLGDNYVDFGVFDPASEEKRRFVNCCEQAIWLDFNVDGVIMDKA